MFWPLIHFSVLYLGFFKDPFNFFVRLLYFEVYWQVVRARLNHFWMKQSNARPLLPTRTPPT